MKKLLLIYLFILTSIFVINTQEEYNFIVNIKFISPKGSGEGKYNDKIIKAEMGGYGGIMGYQYIIGNDKLNIFRNVDLSGDILMNSNLNHKTNSYIFSYKDLEIKNRIAEKKLKTNKVDLLIGEKKLTGKINNGSFSTTVNLLLDEKSIKGYIDMVSFTEIEMELTVGKEKISGNITFEVIEAKPVTRDVIIKLAVPQNISDEEFLLAMVLLHRILY